MVNHYSIDFKYTAIKLYLKIESIRKAIARLGLPSTMALLLYNNTALPLWV